jgi:hypothetical protein
MMLDRSEFRIWVVPLPRGVGARRMPSVYRTGYNLSTGKLDIAGCKPVYIAVRDEAESDEEGQRELMILPPRRSDSGRAPDGAEAQPPPRCGGPISLLLVAA